MYMFLPFLTAFIGLIFVWFEKRIAVFAEAMPVRAMTFRGLPLGLYFLVFLGLLTGAPASTPASLTVRGRAV